MYKNNAFVNKKKSYKPTNLLKIIYLRNLVHQKMLKTGSIGKIKHMWS